MISAHDITALTWDSTCGQLIAAVRIAEECPLTVGSPCASRFF
jgi:hypothetical protein